MIPSSEYSLCLYVYNILEAFARFGDRKENIQVNFSPSFSEADDFAAPVAVVPTPLAEVVLSAEDFVRGKMAQGAPVARLPTPPMCLSP